MATVTVSKVNGKISGSDLELIRQLSLPDKIIAQNLETTPGVINMRVSRVITKLGVENRTAAVVKALRLGLIKIDQIVFRSFDGRTNSH